jgi:hypothetical protein
MLIESKNKILSVVIIKSNYIAIKLIYFVYFTGNLEFSKQ